MPAFTATAPGKIILFGEHAVVYGRPAVAVPVMQVQARAVVSANPRAAAGSLWIQAPDIDLEADLASLPTGHPLRRAIESVQTELGADHLPACTVRVTSTIPVASGLGSGAAVSVAIIRSLSAFLGGRLADERVSALAYEVEKLHHGTPSGIDNTVVTYARPVYFVRGQPPETFRVPQPFTLVIGDTGIPSPTAIAVDDLRKAWQNDPNRYEPLFDRVGAIVERARRAIETGQPSELGPLMDENHELLCEMGVSSPELDALAAAARQAGAWGAKLSGGGRGGNMIAIVHPAAGHRVAAALLERGAKNALVTTVSEAGGG